MTVSRGASAFMRRAGWLAPLLIVMACRSPELEALNAEVDALESKVAGLKPGDTETKILEILGPPTSSGSTFHLSQSTGHERQYADAARSGSVRYHSWFRGVDITCTVGIDIAGRLAYKACGGT